MEMRMAYPAIIERAEDGYSVFFPDLPGCASAGSSFNEAERAAEEALSAHLSLMIEQGEELPAPSRLSDLPHDAEVDEAARVVVHCTVTARSPSAGLW